jgi:hypothetical protein
VRASEIEALSSSRRRGPEPVVGELQLAEFIYEQPAAGDVGLHLEARADPGSGTIIRQESRAHGAGRLGDPLLHGAQPAKASFVGLLCPVVGRAPMAWGFARFLALSTSRNGSQSCERDHQQLVGPPSVVAEVRSFLLNLEQISLTNLRP